MTPESDRKTPPEPKVIPPWEEEAYKQGSEACRNYSQLTMRTRTLAQQILATGVAGLGVAIATLKNNASTSEQIFIGAGVVLLALSFSLLFVDWHYQSAFTAIRNSLAYIESRQPIAGPWLSHLNVRTQFKDHIASYFPFLLLAVVGCASIWYGIAIESKRPWLGSIQSGDVVTVAIESKHSLWRWRVALLIPAAAFFVVLFFFVYRCFAAKERDRKVNKQIGKTLTDQGYKLDKELGRLKYVGLSGDISRTSKPLVDERGHHWLNQNGGRCQCNAWQLAIGLVLGAGGIALLLGVVAAAAGETHRKRQPENERTP